MRKQLLWYSRFSIGQHRPGKVGLDGLPHEKTDPDIVKSLKAILEPPDNSEELRDLHRKDATSTWFGVVRSESQHPVKGNPLPEFKDFGRYAALMAESRPPSGDARYPQLVSFIGQTSAGKSTLVKMLISHGARKIGTHASEYPSPVVGAARDDKLPTSGDVHLYGDPATLNTQFPMLYADCEGLDGGEQKPLAAQALNQPGSEGTMKSVLGGAKRILEWANSDVTSGREYAVKHLYPRLLYTFSDVIVFVLRNAKTFESVALKLLLDWAAASLEKSLNQPVLPHAIVVLNSTDIQVHTDEWEVDEATCNLMSKVRKAIHRVPVFRQYAHMWRKRGKEINTMEDLIKCYYSSIKVVRIPAKGRYMLTDGQIGKLREQIMLSCDEAFSTKERARMLSDVDELNEYLQAGFSHFSERLDVPFNFVDIAVRNNPVPQDLGDHVSNLAAAMQRKDDYHDATLIFQTLSPFVASCLLLEIVRGRRPGSVEDLFDKYYSDLCKEALRRFCDRYLRCSYYDGYGRACRNVKSGHAKGHQDKDGKIIGLTSSGEYESGFSSTYKNTWVELIKKKLAICQTRLEQKRHIADVSQIKILEAQDAFQLHLQELRGFFLRRASKYISMATCYCCLMNVPQHPLPCGHVLCTTCVKSYGEPLKYSSIGISSCPLHPEETRSLQRWAITFKPEFAGVRVLSLDGGGMRGIVELEVLRAVERCLGGKIPVQHFFDLIVGTGTGGIIALGIGAKHWSIDASIVKFTTLCNHAFTPRELHKVRGVRNIVTLGHGSKYKTGPLRRALNAVFGEKYLFGGVQDSDVVYTTKVAVTTTSGTGQSPIIITNYGRESESQLPYKIEFSCGSSLGLRVWQAACATSAAPSFFKPFQRSNRSYMDGSLYYSNPIEIADQERRLLWPDVADSCPDIMLSIGTGQDLKETKAELISGARSKSVIDKRRDARYYANDYFSVLVNRVDDILDAELAWGDFFVRLQRRENLESSSQRYIRLNLDLKKNVPKFDAKGGLEELQTRVRRKLESLSNQIVIIAVAHRLIASSFYFGKMSHKGNGLSEAYTCSGVIRCRFEDGSSELCELGRFLRAKQTLEFQPYFVIEDQQDASLEKKIPFPVEVITAMASRSIFDFGSHSFCISSRLSSTRISLCLFGLDSNQYPISGFPRTFVAEDSLREARLEKERTRAKSRQLAVRPTAVSDSDIAPGDSRKPQQRTSSISSYIRAPDDDRIPQQRSSVDSNITANSHKPRQRSSGSDNIRAPDDGRIPQQRSPTISDYSGAPDNSRERRRRSSVVISSNKAPDDSLETQQRSSAVSNSNMAPDDSRKTQQLSLSGPGASRLAAPKPPFVSKIAGLKENQAVALFTFEALQPGDLSFKQGDIVTVLKKTDKDVDWWTGMIGARVGTFPSNFVEMRN
ncbi:MAG: hypothetical protein M1839_007865 [Geoglossum umbratile]|nr:MAG: hypothetical protein M1839_007865 [Geoglossum umbratile]